MRSAVLLLSLLTSLATAAACGGPPAAARERIRVRLAGGDTAGAVAAYKEWRGPGGQDDPASLRAMSLTAVWSALQSGDPQVRAAATRLAERLNDERLFDAVVNLLRDQDPVVRATAAGAILRGHPDAAEVLRASLLGADPHARAIAIDALARKIKGDAAPDLRPALADPDPIVRSAAADAVGSVGDRDSLPTLLRLAAEDPSGPVRASALAALGKLGGDAGATVTGKAVVAGLQDPYLGARLAALRALEALLGAGAVADLTRIAKGQHVQVVDSEDYMLALRAGVILARRGDRAAGRGLLDAALVDKDWTVRAAAANATIEIAGKSEARKLLAPLARDTIPEVRLAAARALLHAGDRAAAEKAFHSCFGLSTHLKLEAATDLARAGDARSLEVIAALLVSQDPAVRRAAAAAAPNNSPILPALLDALADSNDAVRLAAAEAIL